MNLKTIIVAAVFLFLAPFAVRAASLEISQAGQASDVTVATSSPADLPWEWEALSPSFSYSLNFPENYDPAFPLVLKVKYDKANNYYKKIFARDIISGRWQQLSSQDDPNKKTLTATTTVPVGEIIVLSNPEFMMSGTASWYKYKNGLFAASPDFPKGSVVKVTNLANGKSVDVTINDFGPDRSKHPDRVVDLDKVAFAKIASTGAGVIKVKVELVKGTVPALSGSLSGPTPALSATSAIVVWEDDGRVLFEKESGKVTPLASLTKLVAIRVFLDQRPSLDKIVSYKVQDEKYNYQYCEPWQAARLTVKDGDTLSIQDLLYSALVGSANNAVESLVRVSGLSRDEFIAQMNAKVEAWGASSTHFVEPTGLSPKNVSSPHDYAIITREVFNHPLISKISTASSYTFKTRNTKKAHTVKNTSSLVRSGMYPIVGSKTGYLEEAGNCLMTRVKTPKGNIIVINFGSTSGANSLRDNENLIRFGRRLADKL